MLFVGVESGLKDMPSTILVKGFNDRDPDVIAAQLLAAVGCEGFQLALRINTYPLRVNLTLSCLVGRGVTQIFGTNQEHKNP